jgi:hypothetical protein
LFVKWLAYFLLIYALSITLPWFNITARLCVWKSIPLKFSSIQLTFK